MNRVLKRPMFRRGGSTDQGITSGLRTGYNRGRVVNPGGYKGDDFGEKISTRYETIQELVDKYAPERKPSINDFLINTGLDLMSRPKAGGIFQQIATSAKEPLAKLQQQQEARDLMKERTTRAIIGDLVDYEAKVEAERAGATTGPRKEFEWESQFKKSDELKEERRGVLDQLKELREMSPDEISDQERQIKVDNLIKKADILDDRIFTLDEGKEDEVLRALRAGGDEQKIYEYEELKKKKNTMSPEVYEREMRKIIYDLAEGGRVGYRDAGSVQGPVGEGQNVMQGEGSAVQEESPVQQLSFEELRARLPKSITNDIVRLLADSEQALVDFSSIRTQQDIDSFNQKYGVDLVMPPEV